MGVFSPLPHTIHAVIVNDCSKTTQGGGDKQVRFEADFALKIRGHPHELWHFRMFDASCSQNEL